jgi:selenocysteine lyase/cysteine desulfurase
MEHHSNLLQWIKVAEVKNATILNVQVLTLEVEGGYAKISFKAM